MSLESDARALEQQTVAVRSAAEGLLGRIQTANDQFAARPTSARAVRIGNTPVANQVGESAFLSIISRAPCAQARELDRRNQLLVQQMTTVRTGLESLVGRVTASQKTTELAANALVAAAPVNASAMRMLQTFQRSIYYPYDPVQTPLVLMAFQFPGGANAGDWVRSTYTSLVGQDYAQAHPLPEPGAGEPSTTSGFSIPPWVPIVAGLGIAGWLIWKRR